MEFHDKKREKESLEVWKMSKQISISNPVQRK